MHYHNPSEVAGFIMVCALLLGWALSERAKRRDTEGANSVLDQMLSSTRAQLIEAHERLAEADEVIQDNAAR